jgi:hypothetical protein
MTLIGATLLSIWIIRSASRVGRKWIDPGCLCAAKARQVQFETDGVYSLLIGRYELTVIVLGKKRLSHLDMYIVMYSPECEMRFCPGAEAITWLLTLLFWVRVLNHGGRAPTATAKADSPDAALVSGMIRALRLGSITGADAWSTSHWPGGGYRFDILGRHKSWSRRGCEAVRVA